MKMTKLEASCIRFNQAGSLLRLTRLRSPRTGFANSLKKVELLKGERNTLERKINGANPAEVSRLFPIPT